jgi:hypothetical protein
MRFLPSRQPIRDLSPRPSGYPDKAGGAISRARGTASFRDGRENDGHTARTPRGQTGARDHLYRRGSGDHGQCRRVPQIARCGAPASLSVAACRCCRLSLFGIKDNRSRIVSRQLAFDLLQHLLAPIGIRFARLLLDQFFDLAIAIAAAACPPGCARLPDARPPCAGLV